MRTLMQSRVSRRSVAALGAAAAILALANIALGGITGSTPAPGKFFFPSEKPTPQLDPNEAGKTSCTCAADGKANVGIAPGGDGQVAGVSGVFPRDRGPEPAPEPEPDDGKTDSYLCVFVCCIVSIDAKFKLTIEELTPDGTPRGGPLDMHEMGHSDICKAVFDAVIAAESNRIQNAMVGQCFVASATGGSKQTACTNAQLKCKLAAEAAVQVELDKVCGKFNAINSVANKRYDSVTLPITGTSPPPGPASQAEIARFKSRYQKYLNPKKFVPKKKGNKPPKKD